jgi:hypothetical protein
MMLILSFDTYTSATLYRSLKSKQMIDRRARVGKAAFGESLKV